MNPHDVTLTALANPISEAAEERLARVLEEYLQDLENGRPADAARLLQEHPDLAEPLQECFSGLRFLHEAAQDLRKSPAAAGTASGLPFDRLGDFEIVREIGRGGMGIVYEARQVSLDRRVALKVLPFPAMLDERQIARFENEARAAAQLEHPHIVPVFSVGFDGGVHFFSMQYIDGQPLSRFICELREGAAAVSPDRGHWRRVAEWGLQAADALHGAHQCGVIHRDVKPSNLLVDGKGKLWVADFGLARCHTNTNLTATGGLLGTVNYMSPEQAAGQVEPVDHRTDIYSLGVTLYELLTLREAFAGRDRHDVLRRILEDEPTRPRRLNPAIPIDLETIVLKATAKSAQKRYLTARHLADDLRRFLDGRPILARRATLADHAKKWLGRHKTLAYAGLAMLLVAVLAMAVATAMIARAQSRTQTALRAAETALRGKAEALEQSEHHRQRSEQWFHQAREVLNRLAKRHAEELRELPQADRLRRELLRDSIGYYRSFIRSAADDPALRADLAAAYFQAGKLFERLPETQKALDAYENARTTLTQLVQERPEAVDLQADLALCHNNIGLLRHETGAADKALAALRQAVAIQRRLIEQAPGNRRFRFELALSLGNLGGLYQRLDASEAAEATYRESLHLCQDLTRQYPGEPQYLGQLAMVSNDLGLLVSSADSAQAERLCRQALSTQQTLVKLRPKDAEVQADLALCHSNLGTLLRRFGKFDEAENSCREAIAAYQQLARTVPTVGRYRCELATAFSNLGALYVATDRAAPASQAFHDARAVLEALVDDVPDAVNYRSCLGGVLSNQGTALARLGNDEEAEQAYRQGLDAQRYAVEHAPEVAAFRRLLANQYLVFSRFLQAGNRSGEADQLLLAVRQLQAPNP